MELAVLTGVIVAAGCILAVGRNSQQLRELVSNDFRRRLIRAHAAGAGLGGFVGGTATGLGIRALGHEQLVAYALTGVLFALTGALAVVIILGGQSVARKPRLQFQAAFWTALGFSGPWLFAFVCLTCQ